MRLSHHNHGDATWCIRCAAFNFCGECGGRLPKEMVRGSEAAPGERPHRHRNRDNHLTGLADCRRGKTEGESR